MTLHPTVGAILEANRARPSVHPSTQRIEDRRRGYLELAIALWPSPTPVAEVRDVSLPLVDGERRARLYIPEVDEGLGLLLYFHGGSFVLGDLDTHDALCRRIAADTAMRLLAVDYRLAPEHAFPAGVDDAVGSLRYVSAHVEDFAKSDARIIVMGDSAGATLAAVAAATTRRDNIDLAGQILLYPTMGPELLTNSAHEFGTGYLLDVEHLRFDYEQYLGEWRDHGDARISPLMSLDLTDSAPAVVVVAQYDPLRDEGLAYAGLLEHFGTPVEILEAEGMIHGFLRLGGIVPEALSILDDLCEHLHRFVQEEPS